MSSLFRTKSVEQSIAETEEPEHRLKKNLGALDLTVFGVGVIIGAGIFVLHRRGGGHQRRPGDRDLLRHRRRRPARWPRSATPSSPPPCRWPAAPTPSATRRSASWSPGSSAGTSCWSSPSAPRRCALGFSGYLQDVLEGTPLEIPGVARLRRRRRRRPARGDHRAAGDRRARSAASSSPAASTRSSSRSSWRVVAAGDRRRLAYIDTANYTPFIPPSEPTPRLRGRVLDATADQQHASASSRPSSAWPASSPVRRSCSSPSSASTSSPPPPRRPATRSGTCPIGILGSLAIVTVLYIAVCLVITGMQNYRDIDPNDARAACDRVRRRRRGVDRRTSSPSAPASA